MPSTETFSKLLRTIKSAIAAFFARLAGRWRAYIPKQISTRMFAVGLLLTFAYGFAADRLKIFPYYELRPAIAFIERVAGTQDQTVKITTRQEYRTVTSISTALLPLNIETFNLPTAISLEKTAGAICQAGNALIVLDRVGHPFRFNLEDQSVSALSWPQLPNNYDAFLDSALAPLKSNFRVHDMLCVQQGSQFRVYVAHEFFDTPLGHTRLVISFLDVDKNLQPESKGWQRLFASKPLPGEYYGANGAGGRLALDGKDAIYLTIGDYNLDSVSYPSIEEAQNAESDLGKVFRIDLKSGVKTLISTGHRNMQGLIIAENGDIYITEQGPKGGDELNKIKKGKNYGWPEVTYGTDYEQYSWPLNKNQGRHDRYEKPIFAWVPSIAASQMIEVEKFNDRWKGDLLVTSLKAGTIFRLRLEDGIVRYSEPIWFGPRIRDIIELGDTRIALWTDQDQIILISVDQSKLSQDKRARAPVVPPDSVNCMACHHVGPTNEIDVAPSLSRVLNRKVASDNFAHYSPALQNLGGVWSEDRLREFLLNPDEYAPGTSMVIGDMSKSEVKKAIEYLKNLD